MCLVLEILKKTSPLLGAGLLCLFSFFIAAGQTTTPENPPTRAIKGIVVDSTGESALSQVTIVVQEHGNSQAVKSILSKENGTFTIRNLPAGAYQLVLTCVGYKAKAIELPASGSSSINLGKIALAAIPTQLNEVLVSADKPLLEQNADKIIYNVEADPESKTITTLDLLRKIPMLSVDGDDNLYLNGSSSYRVLVNGRTTSLFVHNPTEVFRIMPASGIKAIEVITTPLSRYEAEGLGGIINLIMHRKSIGGYNGSVNLEASSPKGYNLGTYLTIKKGKVGFSFNSGNSYADNPATRRTYYREDKRQKNWLEQAGESNSKSTLRYLSGELTYEPNTLNLLTISYNHSNSTGNSNFIQQSGLRNASYELKEAYHRFTTGENQLEGYDFGLDYQRSFKRSAEQLLTISYKLSSSFSANNTDFRLEPLLNYQGTLSTTKNNEDFREHTTQADYVHPIKKHTLEMGVKSIRRLSNSDYTYRNRDSLTGAFVLDAQFSNSFDYRQEIYAAYTSLNLKMGQWTLKAGGRLEQTKVDAHFKSSGTLATQDYVNLIPNINLSCKLKTTTLRLSYTQRLERPGLYYLDPYVDRTDPRNVYYGNPKLAPATNHVFGLSYNRLMKRTSFNANVVHYFTNNSFAQFTTLGSDSVARTTFGNIGESQSTGISLSASTTLFQKLYLNLNTSTYYVQFTSTIDGKLRDNDGYTYNAYAAAAFRLKKGWRLSGNFSYYSPGIFLQGKTTGNTRHSATINKSFLKDGKAALTLTANNPLQKHRHSLSEVNDPSFRLVQESYTLIRQFRLSFSYRFGKLQGDITRKKRGIKNDDLKTGEQKPEVD
jgi:outer membrane receptor protein involved in Fe transport